MGVNHVLGRKQPQNAKRKRDGVTLQACICTGAIKQNGSWEGDHGFWSFVIAQYPREASGHVRMPVTLVDVVAQVCPLNLRYMGAMRAIVGPEVFHLG